MRLKRLRPHTRAARTAASKPPASAPIRTPELSTASADPPARRERSGAARKEVPTSPELRLFAVATPGLEPVVAAELQALPGARQLVTVPGGVEFTGDLAALYRANLWLRSASRVLLRLAELRALHFASLRRQIAQLPWERFAPSPVRITVAATAHRCRLYHSSAVAERIALGIADRGVEVLPADSPRAAPELHLIARGADDLFTISLDTSGELLHRRGYRSEDAGAPLRETLAAALLQLCEWDGSTPLLDPTCGSGTLVIEAALLAARRAPGRHRSFAFHSWPTFAPSVWSALLAAADAATRPLRSGLLYAADLDPSAIATARRNAARAGVESLITWSVADLRHSRLPAGPPGLVLSNPPYGVRLRTPQRLYHDLGRLSRSAPGWRLGVLTTDACLARAAGPFARSHPLFSGGLRVTLHLSAGPPEPSPLFPSEPPTPRPG